MDTDAHNWLVDFNRYLGEQRRLSPHTLSNYSRDLDAIVRFCDGAGINHWTQLNVAAVRAYVAQSHRRGLSGRSIQRTLSSLRSFCRFLIKSGQLASNPAQDIRAPKTPHRLPHSLDVDRVQKLLDGNADDWLDQRDLAMMELMYSSALRLAELVALDLQHARVVGAVDHQQRQLRPVPQVGRVVHRQLHAQSRQFADMTAGPFQAVVNAGMIGL